MPGGTQSTSGTTTVAQPIAVNGQLSSLYTSLLSNGGAAASGVQGLQNIASGNNTTALVNQATQQYGALAQASQQQQQLTNAAIKEADGASGTRFSTDTTQQLAQSGQQFQAQLGSQYQQLLTSALQTGSQEQLGASEALSGLLASSANQYYSPQTSTTGSESLPWSVGTAAII